MGKIVKSIGKAIKKVRKGIKKIIKKIGPVLLIAAAVYAGVAFYGASLPTTAAATGMGKLSVSNFMAGISQLGTNVMGFVSPGGAGTAGTGGGSLTGQALLNAGNVATGSGNITIPASSGSAFTGSVTSQAGANAVRTFVSAANTPASGMTTGDAIKYMTKWNMWRTGAEMAAGIFSNKEKDEFERQKELLAMRYSYGAPSTDEQKAFLADNPNYFKGGTQGAAPALQSSQARAMTPAWMGAQTQANLATDSPLPSPYVRQQTIGQPTFGRRSTTQFETPATRATAARTPGLLTQAAKMRSYS